MCPWCHSLNHIHKACCAEMRKLDMIDGYVAERPQFEHIAATLRIIFLSYEHLMRSGSYPGKRPPLRLRKK